MLQAINRYEPLLAHFAELGRAASRSSCTKSFVSAAGELATFTTISKRPPAFPGYRHDRLRESFDPVIASLRDSLQRGSDQIAIPIPLEPKKFGVSVAIVTRSDAVQHGGVRPGGARRRAVRRAAPGLSGPAQDRPGREDCRPCAAADCPGCRSMPLPAAPRQIPFHAGFTYFELDQTTSCGNSSRTRGVALHVAGNFPGLTMEFWAIRS